MEQKITLELKRDVRSKTLDEPYSCYKKKHTWTDAHPNWKTIMKGTNHRTSTHSEVSLLHNKHLLKIIGNETETSTVPEKIFSYWESET